MMTLASIAWPLMALASIVWPLLIYWLVLFVVCFVLVEIGHDQLYDEAPKYAGWRVFGGSLILASLLTALRYKGFAASFDSMFTTNIGWTLLQGVVWFLVFMFVFQFHPWHALGLGVVTMLLVSGLATMGVDSLLAKRRDVTAATRPVTANEPVRQSLGPGPAPRCSGKGTGKSQVAELSREVNGTVNLSVHDVEASVVGYVTREFAHLETLERARRWLIEVGFDPARIEVHTHGVLRITVAVQSGQADEAERILDAVTASDPDGPPSFWDHAHPHHQHHPGGAHRLQRHRRFPAAVCPRIPSTSPGAPATPNTR